MHKSDGRHHPPDTRRCAINAELILPAGTAETDLNAWLAVRRTGVGSSDASALLGVNPWSDVHDVWCDKTGRTPPKPETEAMRWGKLLEAPVRREFTHRSGVAVERTGTWRSTEWPWMLANPDGLTADGGGLEVKTAGDRQAEDWDGQVSDHAEAQAQHCMAVLGLPHWWVAGLIGGQRMVWRRIVRDDALIELLVKRSREFWDHVEFDLPPDPTSPVPVRAARPGAVAEIDRATADALRVAYRDAADRQGADKKAFTAAQDAIRAVIGEAESARCGDEVIATWDHTGKFDEAGFRAAHPEIATEFTVTTETIARDRLAAAHPDLYRTYRSRVLRVKD